MESHNIFDDRELLESLLCNHCGKDFENISKLKAHIRRLHNPTQPCPDCDKQFPSVAYLNRHIMSVHSSQEQKRYKCEICGKGFMSFHVFDGHMNGHNNIKPHQCRWCDKSYQNGPNKAAHERSVHPKHYSNNSKNHSLPLEQSSVEQSDHDYLGSISPDSGTKPVGTFSCDECEYTANYARHIKRHKQIKHLDRVRYPCDECAYSATRPDHLKRHRETQHVGLKYPCDLCEFTTTRNDRLQLHIKSVHGDQ